MRCIIVDDEPLAHKVILNYSKDLPHLEIIKSCHTALEAIQFLSQNSVDLIFLDINMPRLKGLDFLRTLSNPPLIIITTAYQEHALESYELNVCDYLLKPFSFERFIKAVNKVQQQKNLVDQANRPTETPHTATKNDLQQETSIFIKGDKKTHQLYYDNILYLESYGSYIKIHTQQEMIMTLDRLSKYEQLLPTDQFVRIHKSYIVSVKKIDTIEGNTVLIQTNRIPIGKVYKRNLDAAIGK